VTYILAGGEDRSLFVVFIIVAGSAGLLVLQSLLVPREAQATTTGAPLGMFEIGAERGFSSRHLMRAVATLLVLVVLYIALALSLRGVPPYLSMALYSVVPCSRMQRPSCEGGSGRGCRQGTTGWRYGSQRPSARSADCLSA